MGEEYEEEEETRRTKRREEETGKKEEGVIKRYCTRHKHTGTLDKLNAHRMRSCILELIQSCGGDVDLKQDCEHWIVSLPIAVFGVATTSFTAYALAKQNWSAFASEKRRTMISQASRSLVVSEK